MRKLSLLLLLPLLLLLSGCGPIYQTTNSFVPPKSQSGQMCLSQCQMKKEQCSQHCTKTINKCLKKAKSEAMYNYMSYQSKKEADDKQTHKTLDDFYNQAAASCNNTDCGCGDNYNSCFLSCGGQIVPQTTCVAFCDSGKK